MAEETHDSLLGFKKAGFGRVASRRRAAPTDEGGPDRRPVGGSDLLQDALDEIGKQDPDLSNE